MAEKTSPYILDETDNFAVVFKPPRMHSAPLPARGALLAKEPRAGDTLLDWYAAAFPLVMELCGRKKGEGGLLHRLDFETNGLVLFAKTQKALDHFLAQQAEGRFVKEYSAICRKTSSTNPSFPPSPLCLDGQEGFVIESFFRPFGPGRKQVRPVVRSGKGEITKDRYRTEVTGVLGQSPLVVRFAARLSRGFRHQVRCHLAWIGYPILNDPLYGTLENSHDEGAAGGFLALRANSLSFDDPGSSKSLEYRIFPLELPTNSM
ncbi:MAG: pseudouridine synthase [Treponema sp.]|nr:pseudouridine synthase [Treponema sp.]